VYIAVYSLMFLMLCSYLLCPRHQSETVKGPFT